MAIKPKSIDIQLAALEGQRAMFKALLLRDTIGRDLTVAEYRVLLEKLRSDTDARIEEILLGGY